MTEFLKTKMHFALALLGTLFALHPFIEKIQDSGFVYLGTELKVFYAYALVAGLLALTVYCYALTLLSERPHSWVEKTGNYSYALAILVLPLYAAVYLSNLLAEHLGESHLAFAGPVAIGLGVGWLIVSQLLALLLKNRLTDQDRTSKIEQWATREIESINRARELFQSGHYDLSVIEAWKAIESRLRRSLLLRGVTSRMDKPQAMINLATRKHLLTKPTLELLQELRNQWNVAVSVEPLTREAADKALTAARNILATVPIEAPGKKPKPVI